MDINVRKDNTLLESVSHGTKERPIEGIRFDIGGKGGMDERFSVEMHWHPEIEIIYIEKGTFSAEVSLEQAVITAGDFMFASAGDIHALKSLNDMSIHHALIFHPKILSFSYDDEMQTDIMAPFMSGRLVFPRFIKKGDPEHSLCSELIPMIMTTAEASDNDRYIKSKIRLMDFMSRMSMSGALVPSDNLLSSAKQDMINRFKTVTAYMESHLSEVITLEDLSALTHTNSQYLCRLFKNISGQSPIQYLICRRIDRAAHMLTQSSISVLDISIECGFDNVSYFIRKFKSIKGMTPGEYRIKG